MIGKTILHYKILSKLGEGGMGVVYKAEDTKLERTVAIKFLPPYISANDEERKRFEVEARAVATLDPTPLLPLYVFGSENGIMYMAMRLVEGGTLGTLMLQQPLLPNNQIVKIVGDIADEFVYSTAA